MRVCVGVHAHPLPPPPRPKKVSPGVWFIGAAVPSCVSFVAATKSVSPLLPNFGSGARTVQYRRCPLLILPTACWEPYLTSSNLWTSVETKLTIWPVVTFSKAEWLSCKTCSHMPRSMRQQEETRRKESSDCILPCFVSKLNTLLSFESLREGAKDARGSNASAKHCL